MSAVVDGFRRVASRIGRVLFPSARQPMGWRAWVPLICFAAAFGGGVAYLEARGVLVLSDLTPLLLALLFPWVWWLHLVGVNPLGPVRGTLVTFARLSLLGLLILLLTEPRAVRADERLSIVFALDRSASVESDAADASVGYVLGVVATKPEEDEAGLVFFGSNAAVELPPAMSLPFEAVNVEVDREGTDIAEALSLSAAMLPLERQGRIVLISDGVSTEGQLAPVLDDLASRGIAVDVVQIDYANEEEVWLEKLELPRAIKLGETMEPAIVLSSLSGGEGVLTLEENGAVVARQPVTFGPGKNRFSVPVRVGSPGYYEYVARISVPDGEDRWEKNNVATGVLYLQGRGRVLVVVDPEGDARDRQPLEEALRQQEKVVQVLGAPALPRDPLALLPDDCIVFVNVPRDALDEVQMQAVHDAVLQQGSGFLMVGGENSFGPGGYARTPIEDLLPVSMDMSQRKVIPKGALAIILHTCEFAQGNTWGKRITQQAMRVLDPRDEVGVLLHDYSGGDRWLFPLTPAAEFTRLATMVNSASIGDMPGFSPTMQMALLGLQASDASSRHVIIISDGDPVPPPPALLQSYLSSGISVSTVAVFPHGNRDTGTMQQIASSTGGRYYRPQDPELLPSIFIKEAKTLRRNAIQNETFTPTVQFSSPIIRGIEAMPPLHGYVLTTPKPRALTILEGPEEEDLDPVLARWRYGVGVTAAFSSDLSARWGRDWLGWDHFRAFVDQLITDISRVEREPRFSVRSQAVRGEGVIQVEDAGEDQEILDLVAVVDGPASTQTLPLEQVAPRRYEVRFPLEGVGRYRVVVAGASGAGADGDRSHDAFTVPFSEEYLRFRADPIALERIARDTGGRVLTGGETGEVVYTPERVPRQSSRAILDWLLIVMVCLIPLEVAFRRLQLDLALVKDLMRRRSVEESETLGALLARKASLNPPPAQPGMDVAMPPAPGSPPATPEAPPPAQPEVARTSRSAATTETTTERLLAMKKRAQRKKKP